MHVEAKNIATSCQITLQIKALKEMNVGTGSAWRRHGCVETGQVNGEQDTSDDTMQKRAIETSSSANNTLSVYTILKRSTGVVDVFWIVRYCLHTGVCKKFDYNL